ncbi:MAG: glycosyltransferase, partial [bacterium]|nr:glycosyltransferase [bacterium]
EPKRPISLVIAGEGKEEKKFKDIAVSLGIQDQIKFLGFVQKPQEALFSYDVIFFPSRLEGLPLGLLEGMAAGCIPIVSRISGMPEVVNRPEIGWVVENEDINGFSEAMYQALKLNPQEIEKIRNIAVNRVKDNFDLDKSHEKLFAVLGL